MKWALIIDKRNLFRQLLALVLKWNTVLEEIVEVNSLAEARQALANSNRKPDLAIVELDRTDEGGFELIRELRMMVPDVPMVAISMRGAAEQHDGALRAGADDVLTMSAHPKEIVDVVKRLIGE